MYLLTFSVLQFLYNNAVLMAYLANISLGKKREFQPDTNNRTMTRRNMSRKVFSLVILLLLRRSYLGARF
jgi:hypothetical protein